LPIFLLITKQFFLLNSYGFPIHFDWIIPAVILLQVLMAIYCKIFFRLFMSGIAQYVWVEESTQKIEEVNSDLPVQAQHGNTFLQENQGSS
jgi:hypothetical protein